MTSPGVRQQEATLPDHPLPDASDGLATSWLRRLSLSRFRSYDSASLEADARPVVLTGQNGAGKTNLLEALSFLAPGRGLRRARLSEVLRVAAPALTAPALTAPGLAAPATAAWAVAAEVVTPEGPRDLGTGLDPDAASAGRDRRVIKIDGDFVRGQGALGEILGVVWLTPQMDGLFRESAGTRRRFLDRLVFSFDPAHAGRTSAYEHAMRERARLLKSGRAEAAWLDALEATMAEKAVAIAASRLALTAELNEECAAAEGPFPQALLALDGEVEGWLQSGPALAAEDALCQRLVETRSRDAESGGAAAGPHRSDLLVRHQAKDQVAALCSTGEQKALLISMILAHARLVARDRGAPPLLLLDEVVAHLDEARRVALFQALLDLRAQTWMTGTDAALFDALGDRAQFFHVKDGGVTAVDAPRPSSAAFGVQV